MLTGGTSWPKYSTDERSGPARCYRRGSEMRVLHLIKTAVGATWALRQVRELVHLGIEVHVASPDGPLVARYREHGAHVHVDDVAFSVRGVSRSLAAMRAVRRLVDQVAPDLIHSHFVQTTLTMRIALRQDRMLPRIFQVPGPLHLENPFTRAGELALATDADYWIGTCQWTCERYARSGVAPGRVFEAYYGLDVDAFRPAKPRGSLRAELGIGPGTALIGMVAFMYAPRPWLGQRFGLKGHEDLIDAVARLRARGRDVVGIFVGGAWEGATEYEAAVQRYGRAVLGPSARFLGTRADVADIIQDLDVVAYPSHSENLGGTAESLLLARPTVATWVGGLPDLVQPGRTGWLVPPRAPGALADALLEVLANPTEATRRAEEGQRLVRHEMDVRRTAAKVAEIYERIIESRRSPDEKIT